MRDCAVQLCERKRWRISRRKIDSGLIRESLQHDLGSGTPNNCGAVFELSPPASGSTPGQRQHCTRSAGPGPEMHVTPSAGLVFDGSGNLYGTANVGGVNTSTSSAGNGAVYELHAQSRAAHGQKAVLYSFTGGSDGCFPLSDLAYQGGNLYGTASSCGVWRAMARCLSLAARVAHGRKPRFSTSPTASARPYAGVVADPAGNLYGTTYLRRLRAHGGGYGTVYELSSARHSRWGVDREYGLRIWDGGRHSQRNDRQSLRYGVARQWQVVWHNRLKQLH